MEVRRSIGFIFTLLVVLLLDSITADPSTSIWGDDTTLACNAYTHLKAIVDPTTISVSWEKDSVPIIDSTTQPVKGRYTLIKDGNYELYIEGVQPTDGGTYSCTAQGLASTSDNNTVLAIDTTQSTLTLTAGIGGVTPTVLPPATTPQPVVTDNSIVNTTTVILNVKEPSGPGKPMSNVKSKNSIEILWQQSNGDVKYYTIYKRSPPGGIGTQPAENNDWTEAAQVANTTSYTVKDLEPYSSYQFQVIATYNGGATNKTGVSELVYTQSGKPSSPPTNVTAVALDATCVKVMWDQPPSYTINGGLVGYRVRYSNGELSDVHDSDGGMREFKLFGLRPYTNYSISVAVVNDAFGADSVSNFSRVVVVRTLEARPDPCALPVKVRRTASILGVFWMPPDHPNGPLLSFNAYMAQVDERIWTAVRNLPLHRQYYTFTGLDTFTMYAIKVSAVNAAGEGDNSTELIISTNAVAPTPPRNISVTTISPTSVRVEWDDPEVYYNTIESYTVSYWSKTAEDNYTMQAIEPDKLYRVLEKLRQGIQYGVTVQAATQGTTDQGLLEGSRSEPVYFTVNYISPQPDPDMSTTQNNSFNTTPPMAPQGQTGKIVGLVFALAYILALIIVGLTFILIRKRKKDQMIFEKHQSNGVPPAFAKPDDLEEPPVPVSKFEAHVIANHADSDGGFAAEYEDIQRVKNTYPAMSSAELTNKHKNRYTNIIAYDHTRVKLQALPNQPYSDYINANYVDGYNRQRAYIAAQGPLKATFEDFWRMIWEQHTMVIVMITKLEERGRRKCDRYWPAKGNSEKYGDIEVTLEHKEKFASYTIRTFLLKYKHKKIGSLSPRKDQHGKSQDRRITQFHFTDWPDHGVPAYTLPVLSFIQKSSGLNPIDAGPMVVHCSAGVGRTGTYIVIDSMLQQMHAEGKVNVFGFLKRMRTQRNYLVQTEEQYVFIHDVLLDWLKAGNTRIRALDLKTYTDRMLLPDERGRVLLDEQFKLITTQKIHEYEFNKAKHPLNLEKNRNGLLPVERNRVSISCVAGVDGSDYINASFLQGYRGNREFIATQYPKENTMVEFWRMLWETNSNTILMLSDKEDESANESIFWPTTKEETLTFDTLTVTLCEEEHSNISFMTREFLVQCVQDEDQLTVKQFHYSYWPDSCSPIHTAFDLVYALQERSLSLERANKDNVGPIIVMDRYGGRQAGIFCALYTLHQELQNEDAVDVYKTVRLYAAKRPGIFKSKEDYHFIFRALHSIYTAEQQLRSMKEQRQENDKDWRMMRYQTSVHGFGGEPAMRDSTFANSLDSDGYYRTRSQTLASVGTTRQVQRPSKFWHRRTKSEKRKPNSVNGTNTSSLEVTPPDLSPDDSSPEVYELDNINRDSDVEDDSGDDMPKRSSVLLADAQTNGIHYETTAPEIHMNGVELTIDPEPMDSETDRCLELDGCEHISSLLDDTTSNLSSEGVLPDDELAAVSTKLINHHRHKSVESLGQQSSKSEDTYM